MTALALEGMNRRGAEPAFVQVEHLEMAFPDRRRTCDCNNGWQAWLSTELDEALNSNHELLPAACR